MKYVFVYIYVLFFKIIDSFKPFIRNWNLTKKTNEIIKTFSGLLLQIPYINNQFSEKPVSTIVTEKEDCDIKTENCKIEKIITGYIEHDPKKEAFKFFKSI
jgi:hypothetical protein